MKLAKATIYYYNHEGNPTDSLNELLGLKDWVYCKLFDTEEVEIGEWYDDIDLNYTHCSKNTYDKYFTESQKRVVKVCNWVVDIMEVSHLTKITLDEAMVMACEKYAEENGGNINVIFSEGEVETMKDRCFMILDR